MEVREAGDQARNVAARGLHFDGHGNRVSIVLHAKNYRQTQIGRGIQRLPEFAFAGGAVAERDVSDFIAMELDILELAVIALGFLLRRWDAARNSGQLRRIRRLAESGVPVADDWVTTLSCLKRPVRGHLTAAGTGIVGRADGSEQHFIRRRAQGETQRAVAVVGIEPVIAGFNAKAAATPMASCPAPEIWKKTFCWRLSRISRSSTRREVNMMR